MKQAMKGSVLVVAVVLVGATARAESPCGAPEACYRRGVEAFKARDGAAATWFDAACAGGHGESCAELSFLLMEGLLVARDDGRALGVATRGCEIGSGLACNNAFVLVRDGRGRARDDGELRRLAVRSCALDDGEGCYLAAAVLGEPLGGERDDQGARAALDKGCKLGFGMACAVIAHRRLTGEGGEKLDEVGGVKLMARACELGSGAACTIVGTWSASGEHGLVADREKSLGLYRAACELGDDDGCKARDDYLAETARGRLTGVLAKRSGQRVLLRREDGDAPPPGAIGTLNAEGVTLGEVVVKRVEGPTVELAITTARAPDAAWKVGVGLTLTWRRPDETPPTP